MDKSCLLILAQHSIPLISPQKLNSSSISPRFLGAIEDRLLGKGLPLTHAFTRGAYKKMEAVVDDYRR